jgi:hypothetical protein
LHAHFHIKLTCRYYINDKRNQKAAAHLSLNGDTSHNLRSQNYFSVSFNKTKKISHFIAACGSLLWSENKFTKKVIAFQVENK